MKESTLFSILIANYNNGKYLMEAIDSVKKQTYANWEIILVDDCSTDESHSLYKELEQDGRIHIYINEQNEGCGYTKRRCAELAAGELCGFLDPDDALTPNALEVMVHEHAEHPEVSCIGSCYWCCDENLHPQWHCEKWEYSEGKNYLTDFQHLRPLHFAAYKNSLYKQTAGINKALKRAVDMDLYVRLEEIAPIRMIGDILYMYRIHPNQISSKGDFKSMYWEIMCISEACHRRNLPADEVVNEFFSKRIDYYVQNFIGLHKVSFHKRLLGKVVRRYKKLFC